MDRSPLIARSRTFDVVGKIILGLVALVMLVVGAFFALIWYAEVTWEPSTRRAGVAALLAANTPEELLAATTHLGIYIPLADGSWIAIWYSDTHGGRIESLSVARDSGGEWFECKRHFCALFSGYSSMRRQHEAIREFDPEIAGEWIPFNNNAAELDAVWDAPALEEARAALMRMGFVPLQR